MYRRGTIILESIPSAAYHGGLDGGHATDDCHQHGADVITDSSSEGVQRVLVHAPAVSAFHDLFNDPPFKVSKRLVYPIV